MNAKSYLLAVLITLLVLAGCIVWIGVLAFNNVRERRGEIGILRALGLGSGHVFVLFLIKAALIGLLGAAGGYLAGSLVGTLVGDTSAPLAFDLRLLLAVLVAAPALCGLASWIPDDGSARPARELESLAEGLALEGRAATRFEDAVKAATREVPFLSILAAESVVAAGGGGTTEPGAVFKLALERAARGSRSMSAAELQELELLNASLYASVPKKERTRLMAYIGRVQDGRPTMPEDDKAMAGLMRDTFLQLDSSRRTRLTILYDRAIGTAAAPR